MSPETWLSLLRQHRAIAVIRADDIALGYHMAHAIAQAGMPLIEITWNSDRPADLISKLRSELPHCVIGAGTLLTIEQLEAAIAAGAQYLFTPHTSSKLIQKAVTAETPIVAGALTPSEIVAAWQAGATCVKIFPAQAVGGAAYIRSLQGPLGQIPLIPTGGVTLANASDFLKAGAIAVGLAGELFPKAALASGNWDAITQQAIRLQQHLQPFLGKVGDRANS
ncbi:MAG TPA: bifunctional 4-hydroxy-2-oxoglutarate aldolase/2-dehydro-3-deoxy-phosphogluconate aldolase [Leptolyngbyaceae cyanobacterium M33_DOE_097]|uniref:Bifunctional 4-hydroxy-2-oxoglutarate aldolase/2-dehydro-3-deoxy-phosphogluconate aldolase n=1 Tax=Oscillatoriales cyanobacterium SpSt-418 TaxID=2282169 RepID=A0A7C3KHK3_9CYAN|nr:bifunctional 4-hydroxy-2-oxoglutarate aldolase/2-dehydro-3-deoxy-phosphogluconate aldolase [Leptolyngbyaceae cyanobacterium M33_DOE_097]